MATRESRRTMPDDPQLFEDPDEVGEQLSLLEPGAGPQEPDPEFFSVDDTRGVGGEDGIDEDDDYEEEDSKDSLIALSAAAHLETEVVLKAMSRYYPWGACLPVPPEEHIRDPWDQEVDQREEETPQWSCGDPEEVVITVTSEGTVEIAEFGNEISSPVPYDQRYRKLANRVFISPSVADPIERTQQFVDAVRDLRRRRRKKYRRCSVCREVTPPEWWQGGVSPGIEVCQGCAERHFGVVY